MQKLILLTSNVPLIVGHTECTKPISAPPAKNNFTVRSNNVFAWFFVRNYLFCICFCIFLHGTLLCRVTPLWSTLTTTDSTALPKVFWSVEIIYINYILLIYFKIFHINQPILTFWILTYTINYIESFSFKVVVVVVLFVLWFCPRNVPQYIYNLFLHNYQSLFNLFQRFSMSHDLNGLY